MCIKDRNSSNTVGHLISSINPSYLGTNKCVCTHLFIIVITMILEIRIVYSISPVIFKVLLAPTGALYIMMRLYWYASAAAIDF